MEGFQHMLTSDRSLLYAAENKLYSYTGAYFQNTLIAVAVVVVLIFTFGAVYEMNARRKVGGQEGKLQE